MNPWLQLLGSGGIMAVIAVIVTALANRRNLGSQTLRTDSERHRTDAETDELIRKTYGGIVSDVTSRLDAAVVRIGELETERGIHKGELADMQKTIAVMLTDRDDLLRWINHVLRPWIVAGAKPPAPAVPEHLADILPQWVPVKNDDRPSHPPPEETT